MDRALVDRWPALQLSKIR
uniref:Uncharacterized protein n=1 Tax=Lepeophtheirus salmonis TaxID=72036 RepID=A0A0K2TWI7_LEPSM